MRLQELVRTVPVSDHVVRYALSLVRQTRVGSDGVPNFVDELVGWGAGPRAVQFLILGGKARALLEGRFHVQVEDIQHLAKPVLRHRMVVNFAAESDGVTSDEVVQRIIDATPTSEDELSRDARFKRYLRPEVTGRIRRLELTARRVVEGFLSGMHRSPYFGQSIEFLQHRQYTPGDEIRHIDWKVYARQDRLHIKQYEEETNLRLTLMVDRSASMAYGDGESNKFDYSASIAASLAYLALRQKDATGLVTFDTAVRATVPAKSNQQQLTRILSMLDSVGADGRTDLPKVARETAQLIPRRGLVTIISDLLGVDSLLEGLRVLRQRGHDVALFHVLHDHELDFQFDGATRFEALEADDVLNCNPRALREGYLEALNEFLDSTKRACGRLSIDYMQVRTSDPLDAVLAKFLAARQSLPNLKRPT